MQKQTSHTFWKQNFAALLAFVFLVFGTSIHIPLAEAFAQDPVEVAHKHCDFTAEAEESLEESEEEINTLTSHIKSVMRKSYIGTIFQVQIRQFASVQLNKAKAITPVEHLFVDVLLATGRLHSILPG